MQPADTHAAARRAGRGGAPGFDDLHRRRSTQRVGPVPQVGGPGGDDAGCSARCRPSGPAPGALADHQQPIQALGADRADPSLREGVRVGRLHRRVSTTSASSDRNTSSKARQNFASRSRSRKRTRRPRSSNVSRRLRACWATQAPSGLAVTPPKWTCRVSSSIKNSTDSRRSQMVSTVKQVAGDDAGGLLAQECSPRGGGPPWGRVQPIAVERGTDRGGRDLHAESKELALDALVAQRGFSLARRMISCWTSASSCGRPDARWGSVQALRSAADASAAVSVA